MKKITRNDINKKNMVALSYCQCQKILGLFGGDYKVGYNSGTYGWNYNLYKINGWDIVTGYDVPYRDYSNKELKNKLVTLENEVRAKHVEWLQYGEYKKRFLEIFE